LCYGRQESQELQGHVPNPHIETIGKTIVSIMFFYGEAMYFQSNSKLLVVF
jgi:hypothetical protein